MLFLGTYEYSMDERGRLPMPPRFRDALTGGVILTQGAPDRCVRAYPTSGFEEQAALYMNEPVTTKTGRVMRRGFFSGAYPADVDRQGRVLIPPVLRRWADLEGQVVVVGIGEGIEIWNAAEFPTALAEEEPEFTRTLDAGHAGRLEETR
jgi:MraZ protein